MNAFLPGFLTAGALSVLYVHFLSGSLLISAVLGGYLLLVAWLCIRSRELTGRVRLIRSVAVAGGVGVLNAMVLGMLSPFIIGFIVGGAVRLASGARERRADKYSEVSVQNATQPISTPWLIDACGAPESVSRGELLAELDADTAWALARLHRKGVGAEYVAAHWTLGAPLDADALVAAYRDGVTS